MSEHRFSYDTAMAALRMGMVQLREARDKEIRAEADLDVAQREREEAEHFVLSIAKGCEDRLLNEIGDLRWELPNMV